MRKLFIFIQKVSGLFGLSSIFPNDMSTVIKGIILLLIAILIAVVVTVIRRRKRSKARKNSRELLDLMEKKQKDEPPEENNAFLADPPVTEYLPPIPVSIPTVVASETGEPPMQTAQEIEAWWNEFRQADNNGSFFYEDEYSLLAKNVELNPAFDLLEPNLQQAMVDKLVELTREYLEVLEYRLQELSKEPIAV